MPTRGPWVQVAALCESIEPGPPLKINHLVDTMGIDAPPGATVSLSNLTLLVCLWADDVPAGNYELTIQPHAPDGTMRPAATSQVEFPATGASGVNVIAPAPLTVDSGGDYWFDVLFKGADDEARLLSRFPLTVDWTTGTDQPARS